MILYLGFFVLLFTTVIYFTIDVVIQLLVCGTMWLVCVCVCQSVSQSKKQVLYTYCMYLQITLNYYGMIVLKLLVFNYNRLQTMYAILYSHQKSILLN